MDPKDVIYEIDKAIDIVTSRPGLVVIDLPDIQRMDVNENDLKKYNNVKKKKI